MEKIVKLRAEVMKLMAYYDSEYDKDPTEVKAAKGNVCHDILIIIDSMPKESINDDFEKEIDNYINSHFAEGCDGGMISDKHKDLGGVHYKDLIDLAEHFANWQKQKDEKIIAKNNDEYTEGVKGKYITTTSTSEL